MKLILIFIETPELGILEPKPETVIGLLAPVQELSGIETTVDVEKVEAGTVVPLMVTE